jgi:hypothetical protein
MKQSGSSQPKKRATVSLDSSTAIDTLVAMEWTLRPPHAGISS